MCGHAVYCDAPQSYSGRKWENVKVDAGSGVKPADGGSRLSAPTCLENKRQPAAGTLHTVFFTAGESGGMKSSQHGVLGRAELT